MCDKAVGTCPFVFDSVSDQYKTQEMCYEVADIRKNIFAALFSVHETIRLSRHEQVCLIRLHFKRCFSHHRALMIGEVSLETKPN